MPCTAPLVALCLATASGPTYNGRDRQLDVRPPRIDAEITLDGRLDEPVWQRAARLTGFSRYQPSDGVPADDSTEVLVWYSPGAIHFGIRAFALPGTVVATLADRDKIFSDDYVGIFLGTYNDGRQAIVLGANPLGIQGDGISVETGAVSSGFSGASVGREPTDISPNFVYQSKGRLTDYGYEIEITVPFKSLTYQPTETQTWRINIIRKVQSRGYEYSWAPASRAAASFLGQSGRLEGLTQLQRGLVLDINPVLTSHIDGAAGVPPAGSGWGYTAQSPQPGLNVRWGITNNLTLNGTFKPDFAEVESDAGQVVIDPRQALFFPERRPFFLDGNEQFATPGNLVYSRRVLAPLGAAKITGKLAGTSVAFLAAIDDTLGSVSGHDRPFFGVLRLQRDVGAASRVGILVTAKEEGTSSNRVANADLRLVLDSLWSAQLQAAVSRTERPGAAPRTGPLLSASLSRTGRAFGARYLMATISDDFITSAGFIGRPDIARASANHRFTLFGAHGSLLESASLDVLADGLWQYQGFVHQRDMIEKKLHFYSNFQLRGGWHLGASVLIERFGFDSAFYAGYALERRVGAVTDTIPFTGTVRLPNLDYVLALDTPQWQHLSFSTQLVWGQDENFFEWSSGDVGYHTASIHWRPTERVRVEGSYIWQYYFRQTDGSLVGEGRIPRLKVEYQLTRSMFMRIVGQYTATWQDSLRDDSRTGYPILIRNGAGIYQRAVALSSNVLQADWLFSYLPTPGTVIYAGYGSTMTEPGTFKFNALDRRRDGFFVKLSYLFRA